MKGPVLQFPVAFGAITVSYNLPGIKIGPQARRADDRRHLPRQGQDLERSGDRQAQPRDEAAEHGDHGRAPLRLVGDDQGGFTTFLEDVSPTWKSQVGSDKNVKWPVGTGAAKNAGVAAAVKQTQGAIGYVEQAYALENGFTYAVGQELRRQLRAADDRQHLGGRRRNQGPV